MRTEQSKSQFSRCHLLVIYFFCIAFNCFSRFPVSTVSQAGKYTGPGRCLLFCRFYFRLFESAESPIPLLFKFSSVNCGKLRWQYWQCLFITRLRSDRCAISNLSRVTNNFVCHGQFGSNMFKIIFF